MLMQNDDIIMEESMPFSACMLWHLQKQYFQQQGITAWQAGEVPHYVTSNPFIAKAYAETVFAFMRDRQRLQPNNTEKLYLLELGAGSGRLAYHLLTHLQALCDEAAFKVPRFTYILSDVVQANIAFYKDHYKLRPFEVAGLLDYACFDAAKDDIIVLQASGKVLTKQSLQSPVFVIANYFFDSIPQDLFYIEDRRLNLVQTSVGLPADAAHLPAAELLQRAKVQHTTSAVASADCYTGAGFEALLEYYKQHLQRTWLLFPYTGIQCLQRIGQLSARGFVLLTADKGTHDINKLDHCECPSIIKHGSFSLSVNYHAIAGYFKQQGAIALFAKHRYQSINTGCLLAVPKPGDYKELQNAYNKEVLHFGPDDFFSIKKHAERNISDMRLWQLAAYIRLTGYDANFFKQCIPALLKLLPGADTEDIADMQLLIQQVWNMYYPIGEEQDLAFDMGLLLYQMSQYSDALTFFNLSLYASPPTASVYYNMAACYFKLEDDEQAQEYINLCLLIWPNNPDALALQAAMNSLYADAI